MLSTQTLTNQYGETSKNYIKGGLLACNFIVDSANGNGLGLRSLKGNGVNSVYMHTSATPAATNPNPAAGFIQVQLNLPHVGYIFGGYGFVSPSTGSPTAGPSANATVYIAALGSSTLAQWQASGFPVGFTPAVGASFVANGTAIVGGGTVIGPGVSGVMSVEAIGDPTQTLSPSTGGSLFQLQILGATSSGSTVMIPKAPADGTVVTLWFQMASTIQEG